jgi:hypothetical protein
VSIESWSADVKPIVGFMFRLSRKRLNLPVATVAQSYFRRIAMQHFVVLTTALIGNEQTNG